MKQKRQISPAIAVADQPTAADLEALKEEGYAAVVNLRQDGEPDQPMGTAAEGEVVRALGMDYLHLGVGSAPLTKEGVGAFCGFMDRHASDRVLVHCRKGSRASALVLLRRALAEGWSPEEVAAKGQAAGLPVEGGLRTLVEDYLRAHSSGL